MFWRIHKSLIKDRLDELEALLLRAGDTVQIVDGIVGMLPQPTVSTGQPCLALTTLQDARCLYFQWKTVPGVFFHPSKYHVSHWLPRLNVDIPAINRGCIFVPWGLVPDLRIFPGWLGDKLFLRPDSGLKPFPGMCVDVPKFSTWLDLYRKFKNVCQINLEPSSLVCINQHVELDPVEWRCWVVNSEVVGWSHYSWSDHVDTTRYLNPPDAVIALARQVASDDWQLDICYTLDLACPAQSSRWSVLEFNAISTSGLYRVPMRPLINSLRNIAQQCEEVQNASCF